MDRSECQAVVEGAMPPLMRRLGIPHWRVVVSYDPSAMDADGHLKHGECTRLVDYDSAHVKLNPESFDDREQLLRTLRHELFHIVLSPFDLYSTAIDRIEALDPIRDVLDRVWDHACERAVINLERMYAGLTKTDRSADGADGADEEREKIQSDED
jgi:hypothetical protein